MKYLVRRLVHLINVAAIATVCETYGEISELHAGPCGRCVGYRVVGAVADFSEPYNGGAPAVVS